MRLGLVGGALPREALGEHARFGAQALDELARLGDAPHRRGHRGHVAVRHEKARLTVAHRLANSRRVRRDDRRRAGRGLEVRDSPPLLWRRKHERPRAAQQRELLRLADSPKKLHALRRGQASARAPRARADSRRRPRSRARRSGRSARANARMTRCTPLYFLRRPRYANTGVASALGGVRACSRPCRRRDKSPRSTRARCRAPTRSSAVLSLIASNGTSRYTRPSGRSASHTAAASGAGNS